MAAAPRTIVLDRVLRASPEAVFDAIADPIALAALSPGVRGVRLLREGAGPAHGVGALRRVDLWLGFLEEEVTEYERPRRFGYLIHRARPPFAHHGGLLEVEPAGSGTRVRWTTTVSAPVPVGGALATRALAAFLERALAAVLVAVERSAGR